MKKFILRIFIITTWFSFTTTYAQNWDIDLLKKINPQTPNSIVWRGASASAYSIAIAASAGILTTGFIEKNKKLQYKGWEMVGSITINIAITEGLKYVVNRERPYDKYPQVHPYFIDPDPSFPSGHTSTAFATATTLSLELKKWYVVVPVYVWAAGVGYSRLYMGEHYPTDVIGGAIVGTGSAFLSHWLSKKLFRQKK